MQNFTKIENNVLEKIVSMNLSGSELSCIMVLLRKTNGFGKEDDGISISQFMKMTGRSRPTICNALKRLQLVKILILVESGKSVKSFNRYRINKEITEWGLVKKSILVKKDELVKKMKSTSKENDTQLVKKTIHTKETIQKKLYKRNISKDIGNQLTMIEGSSSKKETYGNTDINTCISYLQEKLGTSLDGSVKENRQYCYNLLRKMKKDFPNTSNVDQVKMLIDVALQDKFHSRNTTGFKYLFYNTQRIAQSFKGDYGIGERNSDIQVI